VPLSNWGNFDVGRDGIAYVPVERGAKHIYFYRFADKSTTKVFTFTGAPDFGISISPVDGSIVFAQVTKPRRAKPGLVRLLEHKSIKVEPKNWLDG